MQRFDGRTALVTGAGGGIGRATVARLTDEGARVVCADADLAAAEAAGGASAIALDVTDPASCAAAVAAAGDLDLLVNLAGVGAFAHTRELALEDWNRTLAVNLTGTFLMGQAAADSPTVVLGEVVRDRGLLTIEEAVQMLSDEPARLYGLVDRGRLVEGAHADVVVFDPATAARS